jgi:predicted enzyme related to lactoylglutathione lyase
MISRIHESLSNTIDYVEMLAAYPLRKKVRASGGESTCRFLFFGTGKNPGLAQEAGEGITREIFEFPGGWRFRFREPGGGEFAVWSDK